MDLGRHSSLAALAGASVRLIPEANLLKYLRAESEFEPTVAFLTPAFCALLVKGRKQGQTVPDSRS